MTHPEIDVLIIGSGLGLIAGSWLGYKLHEIVVRVQAHRDEKRVVRQRSRSYLAQGAAVQVQDARDVMRAERQPIPVIPLGPRRSRRQTPASVPSNPDRDDVVAALVGIGYKKSAAVAAVDACTLSERASGVGAWTVCALARAHGAK